MFPSRSVKRLAAGLLEAADAALRPVEVTHPHRRDARVELVRRGGAVESREQPCTCPLPRRADRERAGGAARAAGNRASSRTQSSPSA